MRLAIIDLGTNTFNLLIAEHRAGRVKVLFNEKCAVKLGQGGINSGLITSDAYQRGMEAFEHWVNVSRKFNVDEIFAFATSAVRSASNGKQFSADLRKRTGIKVNIINGAREAELIFKGVYHACKPGQENVLIMDIGGGSTEFIIGNHNEILWKKSYKIGVARLLEQFKPSEPITPEETSKIETYLSQQLKSLWAAISRYQCKILIGSSGSFDTFADLILESRQPKENLGNKKKFTYQLDEFFAIHEQLMTSTKARRMKMPGMLEMRVDMIVLASLCCSLVLRKSGIHKMKLSTYSLKEGAFYQTIERLQKSK